MRLTILLAVAVIAMPAALTAASAPGLSAASSVADLSAAKKKKKPAAKKEEYLKAAPGAGPSGPATKY
jgi:hypothetical protein